MHPNFRQCLKTRQKSTFSWHYSIEMCSILKTGPVHFSDANFCLKSELLSIQILALLQISIVQISDNHCTLKVNVCSYKILKRQVNIDFGKGLFSKWQKFGVFSNPPFLFVTLVCFTYIFKQSGSTGTPLPELVLSAESGVPNANMQKCQMLDARWG